MNLNQFLSLQFAESKKFKVKNILDPNGMFSGTDDVLNLLKTVKWKSVVAKPGKPYSMCMYINRKGRVVLQYDPDFMNRLMSYNPHWVRYNILHEVLHLTLGHMTYRLPLGVDQYRWNVACDLAINSTLTGYGDFYWNIPDFFLLPGRGDYVGVPQGLSAEEYYNTVVIPYNEEHQFANRDHAKWDKIIENTTKLEFQSIKRDLFHKYQAPKSNCWYGNYNIKHGQDNSIDQIPSLAALLMRIMKLKHTDYSSTRRVYNKRYPEYPGKRVEKTPESIVMLVDWSASMSQEQIVQLDKFMRVVNKVFPLDYIPFADNVMWDHSRKFKMGMFQATERLESGGTQIFKSLQEIYAKYPSQDQIIVIVSDFGDDVDISEVRKHVYGASVALHERDHNAFPKMRNKIFRI